MNCHRIQRQLLATAHPDRPPAEVVAHLAECPDCRKWQERLLGIERQIPQVPVPPSREGKRELFRKLHRDSGGEWESPRERRVPCSHTQESADSHSPTIPLYRALTLAAASLLLMVCGWWLLRGAPQPQRVDSPRPLPAPDPLLAELSAGHLRLVQARTQRERVEELGQMVHYLHKRTHDLKPSDDAATLHSLARMYEEVVRDGVVRGARSMPLPQRPAVLTPLAEQLARLGDEAEQWLREASPSTVDPLRQIARAARDGNHQLRTLLQEETP